MDYQFQSQKELYERVKPALNAKESELHRLGYKDIKGTDIWNYLIREKWIHGKDLMLSDIVNDILNTNCIEISTYQKDKKESEQTLKNDMELL